MLLLRRCLVVIVVMFFVALFSAFAWAETSPQFTKCVVVTAAGSLREVGRFFGKPLVWTQ